eukprot:403336976
MKSKQFSKSSFGKQPSQDFGHNQPLLHQGSSIKKRDSKRYQKSDNENHAKLLEYYNDLKTIQENKELPSRQVYLRRIGLYLVKVRPDLYRFPVLQAIEETSKIMLMNEFELLYWYDLMRTYLVHLKESAQFSQESVRLFFFQCAMFVKRFLFQIQQGKNVNPECLQRFKIQIDSIEAYIKAYHYSNFDTAYQTFDKQDLLLLDPEFKDSGAENIRKNFGESYESFSYLTNISTCRLQELFNELRQPFETDNKINIIDYNWHVDGILKNSQSYNKENSEKKEQQVAKKIEKEDLIINVKSEPIYLQERPKNTSSILPGNNMQANHDGLLLQKRRSIRDQRYPTQLTQPTLQNQDSLFQLESNTALQQIYQNMLNSSPDFLRGTSSFPGLAQLQSNLPFLTNQDSLFNPKEVFQGYPYQQNSLRRNPSMLSSKSKNEYDGGDNNRYLGHGSNPSVLKPVTKKPMVPHPSNNNLQMGDLQRNTSLSNFLNSDQNIKLSAQDLQKIQLTLVNLEKNDTAGLKIEDFELHSPQLDFQRSQSASTFLIGPGQQPPTLGLNKTSSFIGYNNYGSAFTTLGRGESSAFQNLRVKEEKQNSESKPPEMTLNKSNHSQKTTKVPHYNTPKKR